MEYQEHLAALIAEISLAMSKHQDISATYIASRLDPTENNSAVINYAVKNCGIKKPELKRAIARKALADRRIEILGSNPQIAEDFVSAYLFRNEVTCDFKGILTVRGTFRTSEQIKRDMRLAARALEYGFKEIEIADPFVDWKDRAVDEALAAANIATSYVAAPGADAAFLTLAASAFDDDPRLVAATLKKFVWQVKRKMRDMTVTNHLMPVILGAQQTGKTYFIELLCRPLVQFTLPVNFASITESRYIELWRFFIHTFDEMSYASRSDCECVKEVITADYLTRRPMGSNDFIRIKQRATSIGSSNQSLAELITDTTGNRRFAPLNFRRQPDRAVINETDYLMLWRSVDENGADPMIPYMHLLQSAQAADAHTSMIEDWFGAMGEDERTFEVNVGKKNDEIAVNKLHEHFAIWEQTASARKMGLKKFSAELRRLIEAGKMPFRYTDYRRAQGVTLVYTWPETAKPRLSVVEGGAENRE